MLDSLAIQYSWFTLGMNIKYSNFECGFHKSYNTQHCLIVMVEEWEAMLGKGKNYGALLTDHSKTFYFYSLWSTHTKNFIHMVFMTYHYNLCQVWKFRGNDR